MADKKKPIPISEKNHPLYRKNYKVWKLYLDSAEGGDAFITDDNLRTHRLEESEDYQERLERAYFLNYCDTIPTIYNSYIFREEIKRKPDDNLEGFRKNVDGNGMHINDYIKLLGYLSSVTGVMHVLVDVPTIEKENPTVADIKESGAHPFCSMIYPTQLKDWSIDEQGMYNWVIIEYEYLRDIDPTQDREIEKHYKVITKDKWWVEDKDGNKVKYEDGSKSNGTNELGFVPLLTIYHKANKDDKVGQSLLKDIVYINRAIMNWCSCLDEQIERQTFSQLIVPDDGGLADTEDDSGSGDALNKTGTAVAFTFPKDATHPPAFISPTTDHLSTIWKLVLDHVKEMFRMAGLQGGTSDLYTSRSGRQSQMSFMGVNSALAEKSATYEKFENQLNRLVYAQMGEQVTDKFEEVRYPRSFDVVSLLEEIDGILKIMERNFSTTLNKVMMKDIARKAVPLALPKIRKQIEQEIEDGDGLVETVKTSTEIQPEKDGDGNTNSDAEKSFKPKDQVDKEQSSHRKDQE